MGVGKDLLGQLPVGHQCRLASLLPEDESPAIISSVVAWCQGHGVPLQLTFEIEAKLQEHTRLAAEAKRLKTLYPGHMIRGILSFNHIPRYYW